MSDYFIYIVSCSDGTLYTGITTDIDRRIEEHNGSKKGAQYTKVRRPVQLVYSEKFENRSTASQRECLIKQLTRKEKEILIKSSLSKNSEDIFP